MKTLLIGIDGMSYRMMKHLSMPYVRGLESRAISHGLLRSFPSETGIPFTGPCWVSIYTGLLPHEHGFTLKGWLYGENYFNTIQHKTIFDVAGHSLAFTMPITFPATAMPDNVLCVAGFPTVPHHSALVNDERLRPHTDGFLLDIMDEIDFQHAPEDCNYRWQEELKFRACRVLAMDHAPENVFVGLTFIDRLNHHNPQGGSILRDAYAFLDDLIYEYITALNPTVVILCGDHGFRPSAFMPTDHDDEGYYLFTSFGASTGSTDTTERDLTHVARMFSSSVGVDPDWIGTRIIRADYLPTTEDRELIMSRLKALGYV